MASNRTRKPDPSDRAFVVGLVEQLGTIGAAKRLGLSRLATLNIATGGTCYASTLRRVQNQRPASSSSQAA